MLRFKNLLSLAVALVVFLAARSSEAQRIRIDRLIGIKSKHQLSWSNIAHIAVVDYLTDVRLDAHQLRIDRQQHALLE